MHDITEGGVLGAIWEASKAVNKGVFAVESAIPIKESTKAICNLFDIDPLKLISSGCMLIICDKEKKELIINELNKNHIEVSEIGKITKESISIIKGELVEEIHQPESDELYKVI